MTADLGFPVSLLALSRNHSEFCRYSPEIFPGLSFKMINPKASIVVFANGKVVVTGVKSFDEGVKAFHTFLPLATKYKKERHTHNLSALDLSRYYYSK